MILTVIDFSGWLNALRYFLTKPRRDSERVRVSGSDWAGGLYLMQWVSSVLSMSHLIGQENVDTKKK